MGRRLPPSVVELTRFPISSSRLWPITVGYRRRVKPPRFLFGRSLLYSRRRVLISVRACSRGALLVEAFVAQTAVETLHVGVLIRLAWLDQAQLQTSLVGFRHHRLAIEILVFVGAGQLRLALGSMLPGSTRMPRRSRIELALPQLSPIRT